VIAPAAVKIDLGVVEGCHVIVSEASVDRQEDCGPHLRPGTTEKCPDFSSLKHLGPVGPARFLPRLPKHFLRRGLQCRSEADRPVDQAGVDQIPDGERVGRLPRDPTRKQIVLFLQPLCEGSLPIGIVGHLAEVVELPTNLLGLVNTLVLIGKKWRHFS
jgi:hypothetical protein